MKKDNQMHQSRIRCNQQKITRSKH